MEGCLDPSRVIAAAYAAGLDSGRWREALAALVDISGASGGQLLVGKGGRGRSLVSIGIDPAEDARYNQYYSAIDPLPGKLSALDAGGILSCREAISRKEADRSSFFVEWADPNHVSDAVFVRLTNKADELCALALGHPRLDKPFLRPALETYLKTVGPHLVNAFDMSRRLEGARVEAQACKASFDLMGCGWMLASSSCLLRDINRIGRSILDDGDGLRLHEGKIEVADPRSERLFQKAVGAATDARRSPGDFARPVTVPRPSGGLPYTIRIMPHQTPDAWFNEGCDHVVMVITDPAREERNLVRALTSDYGLTAAEAQVAIKVRLARGLRHVALERGISLSTTRVHLQRVFEKTATHRQSELIVLMASLCARLQH